MALELIIDVNDQNQNGLLSDLQSATSIQLNEFFNGDTSINLTLQPVRRAQNGSRFETDYVSDDTYYVQIGNVDDRATGGTFNLEFTGFANSGDVAHDVSAAALKTAIDATSTDAGYGEVTVTMLQEGVYRVDWENNGSVPDALTPDATRLEPSCEVIVSITREGDASTPAQQIITIRQSPVASVTLTALATEVTMTSVSDYTPSNQQNAVWTVYEGDYIYGNYGLPITVNGIASTPVLSVGMDETQIGLALSAHPEIHFQDDENEDNISVIRNGNKFSITFIGTLAGSTTVRSISANSAANPTVVTTTAAHGYKTGDTVVISGSNSATTIDGSRVVDVISATTFSVPVNCLSGAGTAGSVYNTSQPFIDDPDDLSLVWPAKLDGTLNLNTVALLKQFSTTTADELDFVFQVRRERDGGGENRIIYSDTITLKRELIDLTTLSPLAALDTYRSGSVVLSASDTATVTFATAMPDANYHVVEAIVRYTGGGAAGLKLCVAGIEDRATTGFTVYFNGNATTDYTFDYTVTA